MLIFSDTNLNDHFYTPYEYKLGTIPGSELVMMHTAGCPETQGTETFPNLYHAWTSGAEPHRCTRADLRELQTYFASNDEMMDFYIAVCEYQRIKQKPLTRDMAYFENDVTDGKDLLRRLGVLEQFNELRRHVGMLRRSWYDQVGEICLKLYVAEVLAGKRDDTVLPLLENNLLPGVDITGTTRRDVLQMYIKAGGTREIPVPTMARRWLVSPWQVEVAPRLVREALRALFQGDFSCLPGWCAPLYAVGDYVLVDELDLERAANAEALGSENFAEAYELVGLV